MLTMDEIEVIDLMLKYDFENNNGERRGFISASRLFDKLDVPKDMRSYILSGVIELGLYEYNNPKMGIRATYRGRKIYRDGGFKKYRRNKKIADIFGYLERIINTIKP